MSCYIRIFVYFTYMWTLPILYSNKVLEILSLFAASGSHVRNPKPKPSPTLLPSPAAVHLNMHEPSPLFNMQLISFLSSVIDNPHCLLYRRNKYAWGIQAQQRISVPVWMSSKTDSKYFAANPKWGSHLQSKMGSILVIQWIFMVLSHFIGIRDITYYFHVFMKYIDMNTYVYHYNYLV